MATGKKRAELFCTSEGYACQMFSDGKQLYIIRLGRENAPDPKKKLASPEDYVAAKGNLRIRLSGLDSVQCLNRDGGTTIILKRNGKTRRYFTDRPVSQEVLEVLFDGAPLKKRGGASGNSAHTDRILTVICFALLILLGLCGFVPALGGLGRLVPLGWVLIPLVWLYVHAADGFLKEPRPDLRLASLVISIVFLWITPPRPDNRLMQLLPALPLTILAAVMMIAGNRKFEQWLILPVIVALIAYAPAAALCINNVADVKIEDRDVAVEDLSENFSDGNWYYYIAVSSDGVTEYYNITRNEYAMAEQGGYAIVRTATGLLGIKTTDIVIQDFSTSEGMTNDEEV